jgi:tetratricopeptide (TPR) repeat protein
MLQRITRIQPVIECRGTPVQRADLFGNLNRYLNLSNHFAPSDIALESAYSALAIISPSARPEQRAPYQFVLGLTLVLHGDYVEAVSVLTAALEVAESIGDVTLQARCLAYLIVAFRRQGCSGDVEAWARRCLDVSERAGLPNYIGASRAALAWVAWRRGALEEAEQFGRSALDAWHTMNMPYPFSWQALWPLIGVALVQDRLADAISLTRRLYASDQQALPPILEEPLIAALTVWNTGQAAQAYDALRSALELAEQNNFS